jgi:hypothetical protein
MPVQAKPAKVFYQLVLISRFAALDVRIFHAKDKVSPCMPGEQPVVKCRSGVANMQHTGRRGRESNARFIDRHNCFNLNPPPEGPIASPILTIYFQTFCRLRESYIA